MPAIVTLDSDDCVRAGLQVFRLSADFIDGFWRLLRRFWLVFPDFLQTICLVLVLVVRVV